MNLLSCGICRQILCVGKERAFRRRWRIQISCTLFPPNPFCNTVPSPDPRRTLSEPSPYPLRTLAGHSPDPLRTLSEPFADPRFGWDSGRIPADSMGFQMGEHGFRGRPWCETQGFFNNQPGGNSLLYNIKKAKLLNTASRTAPTTSPRPEPGRCRDPLKFYRGARDMRSLPSD